MLSLFGYNDICNLSFYIKDSLKNITNGYDAIKIMRYDK